MKKLKYLFLIIFSSIIFVSSVDAAENESFYTKTLLGKFVNGQWEQVASVTSQTNQLILSQIGDQDYEVYPVWMGFYGNASKGFTTDKIYNLSFRIDYSQSNNRFFQWKKAIQYAKMEIKIDNSVVNYCTMNANNDTYSEFTCEFKVSKDSSSYYEININWWNTNLYNLGFDGFYPDMGMILKFGLNLTSNTDYNGQIVSQNEIIIGQNQQIIDSNNKTNDILTNDKVNGVEKSFESFEKFVSENSTITQLITMPITLYSSILNGIQSTCQPFILGNLFGTNLTIPCINIGNYLGTALWSMIDIIISGFAIFAISKKLIKIFNNFSSMKEGDVIND